MTTNPGGPIILTLTEWAENNISAIYKATTQNAFNSAFNAFVADDAHITVNGHELTREKYRQLLQDQTGLENENVTFSGAVGVLKKKDNSLGLAGNAGIFYKATGNLVNIRSLSPAPLRIITSSLNITVVQVGTSETRVVSAVNQVVLTEDSPNVLPTPQ
ncbi:uncharacterized protein FIBRA_01087 [Fibroporia radiculosa]|uniref:Uncharacterized protein n=1 Tax=Fibroporia radiculosa TaxID=599839 RepID=J4GJA1_9APHY|nr:uncharacterized protein FIBRA_01087 [Fibroporia radiculosa]CCL99075.1 predicted protein [Fibroporia radiculosa]